MCFAPRRARTLIQETHYPLAKSRASRYTATQYEPWARSQPSSCSSHIPGRPGDPFLHSCIVIRRTGKRILAHQSPVSDRGFYFLCKGLSMQVKQVIRLSLPSKGRLELDSLAFLAAAGLRVFKSNPRQYQAEVPAFPGLSVIFQRPGDIVVSVRQGSVDFGITGLDVIEEKRGTNGDVLILHDGLGFGFCALTLAIPEAWKSVQDIPSLKEYSGSLGRPLRVATKFPVLTERFLNHHQIPHTLIAAEGTLE